jgi:mycothiol synthase
VTVTVGPAEVPAFLAYCAAHRFDHDESFLDEHSLSLFRPGPTEKAVLLLDDTGRARAAAALMMQEPYREMGRARFRIFHAVSGDQADYRSMLDALLPVDEIFRDCYLFLPTGGQLYRPTGGQPYLAGAAAAAERIVERLGFHVDRRSWLLSRALEGSIGPGIKPDMAAGLRLESCDPGSAAQVEAWCAVINDAFAGMAGHATHTPAMFAEQRDPSAEFPGGNILLFEGSRVIGLVAVKRDVDEPSGFQAYLGPVAVRRDMQRCGLGRALLREGLRAAQARGFTRCVLTVNGENENALSLYLDEGFERQSAYTCWALPNPAGGQGKKNPGASRDVETQKPPARRHPA